MATVLSEPLPTHSLYEFLKPSWIENLAIRSNGQILFTILTSPDLYLFDPSKPSKPILIHSFQGYLGLMGITEVGDDIFYIGAGNFNLATFDFGAGSYAVWRVDMRPFSTPTGASIKKLTDVPDAMMFNGLETLAPSSVLIADSAMGAVWKVNITTGQYAIFADEPEMKRPSEGMPLGINGIKVRDEYLYWTNSGLQLFCRIKIDGEGKAEGKAEVMKKEIFSDDFVFDTKGNVWLAQNIINTISVLKGDGQVITVAGKRDQLTVAGPTSCKFGRGADDQHILYVATTGGLGAPINGEFDGAKIMAVDTKNFGA